MRVSPRCELTTARVAGGLLLLAALVPPAWVETGAPLCPFRLLTGLPCPGCGLTRSVVCTLHGDLASAMVFHPLGPLVAAALAVVLLAELLGPRLPGRWRLLHGGGAWRQGVLRAGGVAPWVAIGLFVVVWLVRLPLYLEGRWVY